jgi:hypothetical protein
LIAPFVVFNMSKKSFNIDASHSVINTGDETVIVAANVKDREAIGNVCAAKNVAEFKKAGRAGGSRMNNPIRERGESMRVVFQGLPQSLFGDDPHSDQQFRTNCPKSQAPVPHKN